MEREAFTVGHGARPLQEFVDLLQEHDISRVVDVRRYPRSRRNPQFDIATLPTSLGEEGIAYSHLEGLGGRRQGSPDSVNLGWRNSSFRGYADYMQTEEFREALEDLLELIEMDRVALMCAETVPWRCHRSLIADALIVRGILVTDLISEGSSRSHALTPFAVVEGVELSYPKAE